MLDSVVHSYVHVNLLILTMEFIMQANTMFQILLTKLVIGSLFQFVWDAYNC